MSAGTVISGGFPGRVAQEVQPNPKCRGCLHYVDSAGRTGACSIGLRPWLCGDTGDAADIGYAPIDGGAGAYLPDMSNHGAHAHEVETQCVSDLYGAGSTKPVQMQQVSLGEEHVHLIKSMVSQHTAMQKSQCRLCKSAGTHGMQPFNNEPQVCTCEPIEAIAIAKSLASRLTNRQRASMTLEDVTQFVYDVAKSGFKMPVEKAHHLTKPSDDLKKTDPQTAVSLKKIHSFVKQHGGIRSTLHDDHVKIHIPWRHVDTGEEGTDVHKVTTMSQARRHLGY